MRIYKPSCIPQNLLQYYHGKGWTSWGDILGTGTKTPISNPITFEEARIFARKMGFKSCKEWRMYCKVHHPPNIPTAPEKVYKNLGWKGWPDFLGNISFSRNKSLSFREAREFARTLGLNGKREWLKFCSSEQRHKCIPINADTFYKHLGWEGWADFLGNAYLPFGEARVVARSLGLTTKTEWDNYCQSSRKHRNIPFAPDVVYKNLGWNNWGDFLGTGILATRERTYVTFEEARMFAKENKINTQIEWWQFCKTGKRPINLPSNPQVCYKDHWKGWPYFLGRSEKDCRHEASVRSWETRKTNFLKNK